MSRKSDELERLNKLWRKVFGVGLLCLTVGSGMILFNPKNPGVVAATLLLAATLLSTFALVVIQPKINKLKNDS